MSSLSSAAAPAQVAGAPMRLSHLGDELLARYAARGSERAFALLYERYHQQLYRYCRSILRNDLDAQDALQSTFVGALQALRRNQRNAPLRPWLYRIAHNEAISLLRRRSRDAAEELPTDSHAVGLSVEQEATARARWRSLIEDLGSLPERQRGALLLRELNGLSHEEIAIALSTTSAGAKQAIFEARQALAEIEEGRSMSCEEVRQRISEGDRRMLRGRRVNAHVRECAACETFALAIPARREQLRALTPVLPPAASAALLARSLHGASSNGAAAGGSAAATAGAGVAGKAAGAALAWKTLAGVALVATTAAGVTGVSHLLAPAHTPAPLATAARSGHSAFAQATDAHAAWIARQAATSLLEARSGAHAQPERTAAVDRGRHGYSRAAITSHRHSHPAKGKSHGASRARIVHSSSHGHGNGSRGHSYSAPIHRYSKASHRSTSSSGGLRSHASAGVSQTSGGVSQTSAGVSARLGQVTSVKKILTLTSHRRRSTVRIHKPSR
jgi:RNA polymerase sigma factor (sigma-70 family)